MNDYSHVTMEDIARELAARTGLRGTPSARNVTTDTKISSVVCDRYIDAYLVSNVTVGLGKIIKFIAFLFSALIFIGIFGLAIVAENRSPGNGAQAAIIFVGIVSALIVGFVFHVIGILVSPQGQVLKATLDNAVNGSPFLTNELKTKMMSLS